MQDIQGPNHTTNLQKVFI